MGLKEEVANMIEKAVHDAVESQADAVLGAALDELKKVIPGQIDDAIIEAAKPAALVAIKAELLKLVDKINGHEG